MSSWQGVPRFRGGKDQGGSFYREGYQKPGEVSQSSGLGNEGTLWFFTPEEGQAALDSLMLLMGKGHVGT
jgi:hypothetical protein